MHLFSLFLLFQLRSFHVSLARRSVAIGGGRTCLGASECFFFLSGWFFSFFSRRLEGCGGVGVSVGLKQSALMQECCILWWFLLFFGRLHVCLPVVLVSFVSSVMVVLYLLFFSSAETISGSSFGVLLWRGPVSGFVVYRSLRALRSVSY